MVACQVKTVDVGLPVLRFSSIIFQNYSIFIKKKKNLIDYFISKYCIKIFS